MLRCIVSILQDARRDDQKAFMETLTATAPRATCVVYSLLRGILSPELPTYLLMIHFGFLTYVAAEIPDSSILRERITVDMVDLIMATYSAIARHLCIDFSEQVFDVVKYGCDAIL